MREYGCFGIRFLFEFVGAIGLSLGPLYNSEVWTPLLLYAGKSRADKLKVDMTFGDNHSIFVVLMVFPGP